MGAINFGTLTNQNRLAIVHEPETEQEHKEQYFYYYELNETQKELNKHNFYYFNLTIKKGYYDGFYLKLTEENTKYIYDNEKEKTEVLKELTAIQNILIKFVKNGILWGCYPSWIYNRLETTETIKQIRETIKELKTEVKASYTEYTANKQNKNIFDVIKEYEVRG